ncbi:Protein of unknown function [Pyronema omphalodes CBS 100304]|uniref:Uncharacterized protein n=1 Tax=Pyronema omphalodes (strain CBS 100304) TaxID=1076935 RepID=U4L3R4_PYROM|nr:Protein of unknown function [Pyronema omphalodes CBS 100304]
MPHVPGLPCPKTLPPNSIPTPDTTDTPYRITTPLSFFEKLALSSLSSSFPVDITPKPARQAKPELRVITQNLSNYAERALPDLSPLVTSPPSPAAPTSSNNDTLEATQAATQLSIAEQMYGKTSTWGQLFNLSAATVEVEDQRERLQRWVDRRGTEPGMTEPQGRRFTRSVKKIIYEGDEALLQEQQKELWAKGYEEGFKEGFLWCSVHNHSHGRLDGEEAHGSEGSHGSNGLGVVTMPRPEDFIAGPYSTATSPPSQAPIQRTVPYWRRDSEDRTFPVFTSHESDSRDGDVLSEGEFYSYYSHLQSETPGPEPQAQQEERPPRESAPPYPQSPTQPDRSYKTPPLHYRYRVDPDDLISRLSQVSLYRSPNSVIETPIADTVYPPCKEEVTPNHPASQTSLNPEVPEAEEESEWCYISQYDQPDPPVEDLQPDRHGEYNDDIMEGINEMIDDMNNSQTQATWAMRATLHTTAPNIHRSQRIHYRNPHALTTSRLAALDRRAGVMATYAARTTMAVNPGDSSRRPSTSDGGSYTYPYPRPLDSMARSTIIGTTMAPINPNSEGAYPAYRARLQRLEEVFGRRDRRGRGFPHAPCELEDPPINTERLDPDRRLFSFEADEREELELVDGFERRGFSFSADEEEESDLEGTGIPSSPTVPQLVLRGGRRSPIESSDGVASPPWPANPVIRENGHVAVSEHGNIEENEEEEAWERYSQQAWDNSTLPERSFDEVEWSEYQAALPLPVQVHWRSLRVESGQERPSETTPEEEADNEAEEAGDEDGDWESYDPERWGTATMTAPLASHSEVSGAPASAHRTSTPPVSAPEEYSPLASSMTPLLATSTTQPETTHGSVESLGDLILQDSDAPPPQDPPEGSVNAGGSSNAAEGFITGLIGDREPEGFTLPHRDFPVQLGTIPGSYTFIVGSSTFSIAFSDQSRQADVTNTSTPTSNSRNTTSSSHTASGVNGVNGVNSAIRQLWRASSTPNLRSQPRTHLTSSLRFTKPSSRQSVDLSEQVGSDEDDEEAIRGHVRHSSVDKDGFQRFVPPPPTPQSVRDRIRRANRNHVNFLSFRYPRQSEAVEATTASANPDVVQDTR